MAWKIDNQTLTYNLKQVQEKFGLKYLPMVRSLLQTDMYKFSMGQVFLHQFPAATSIWDFKARNIREGSILGKFTDEDVSEITKQIRAYCALSFDDEELAYLTENYNWIHYDYADFLRDWKAHEQDFSIESDENTGIKIQFTGTHHRNSFYEIPVLSICTEVYYRNHFNYDELLEEFKRETTKKIEMLKSKRYDIGLFSEFGTRRRLSHEAQEWLIQELINNNIQGFVGTSNVDFARQFGIKAIGTMAHEFIMLVGQGYLYHNPAYSNWFAMDAWIKEYGTKNGIVLTDTIGTNIFLKDFQTTFSTLFSGVRHDSGDPIEWGQKMLNHYKSLGINPKTKTLLFSDSLDFERATNIKKEFENETNVSFGIGTYLSGPQGIPALNIVCKPVIVNELHVAKLSDSVGKNMCRSQEAIDRLKSEISWREKTGK